MSRPFFFCFCFIAFVCRWFTFLFSLHASSYRVEARMLLGSSAATNHTGLCVHTSLSKHTSSILLNNNCPFLSCVFRPVTNTTLNASRVKRGLLVGASRYIHPGCPTRTRTTERASPSFFISLASKRCTAIIPSDRIFANLSSCSNERSPPCRLFPTHPHVSFSTLSCGLSTYMDRSPGKIDRLSFSSPRFHATKFISSTLCRMALPSPPSPVSNVCLPLSCSPPAPLPSIEGNSSALAHFVRKLSPATAGEGFFRTFASTVCTTLVVPPIPSSKQLLRVLTPTIRSSSNGFTSERFPSDLLLPHGIHPRVQPFHLSLLLQVLVNCCSKTTPFSFLQLPSANPSNPDNSNRVSTSKFCCWQPRLGVPRQHAISQNIPSTQYTPSSSFPGVVVASQKERYHCEVTRERGRRSCNELLYAVPLLSGITRSTSPENAGIPEFLLPPLFTAVEAADQHHAQDILAFWKKPGVPRVGWTDDMIEVARAQQVHATRDNDARPPPDFSTYEKGMILQSHNKQQTTRDDNPPATVAPSSSTSHSTASSAISGLTDQGEALLIVTGSSPTHLDTLAEAVVEALWEKHTRKLLGRDGRGFSGWVALAFMDLEVHIMTPVTRERYALEELYSLCPRIDISDVIKIDKLHGFEFMSGGIERFEPGGPPFDPELDADYGLYE